jgi:hypothetical protein
VLGKEERLELEKKEKIKTLKDLTYRMMQMRSGDANPDQSQKNFIYNEDNVVRLVYMIAI